MTSEFALTSMLFGGRNSGGGKNGASAYEIAVKNGFIGSEADWLMSLKGETGPQGPAYSLTEADKSAIVTAIIESLGGNPIFGYVDGENNIIVQGHLAEGTYSVKYEIENEDGSISTVDIGNLLLETDTEELPDEPVPTVPTNFANPSDSLWQVGYRLASSYGDGKTDGGSGHILTNFIPARKGDVIYVKGLDITGKADGKNAVIATYTGNSSATDDFQDILAYTGSEVAPDGAKSHVTVEGDTYVYTVLIKNDNNVATDATAYIRIDGIAISGVADSDIVINVKRNGEWL